MGMLPSCKCVSMSVDQVLSIRDKNWYILHTTALGVNRRGISKEIIVKFSYSLQEIRMFSYHFYLDCCEEKRGE